MCNFCSNTKKKKKKSRVIFVYFIIVAISGSALKGGNLRKAESK